MLKPPLVWEYMANGVVTETPVSLYMWLHHPPGSPTTARTPRTPRTPQGPPISSPLTRRLLTSSLSPPPFFSPDNLLKPSLYLCVQSPGPSCRPDCLLPVLCSAQTVPAGPGPSGCTEADSAANRPRGRPESPNLSVWLLDVTN